jgi:hypothetical protein
VDCCGPRESSCSFSFLRLPSRTPIRLACISFLMPLWHAPLVIVVLAFFAGGAGLAVLFLLGTLLGQRRELARLQRELTSSDQRGQRPAPPGLNITSMIEFEYWQLLLFPLFFGLGWAAARIDIRHLVKESRALPRSYFQGLNFLLNEQPDRAIEAFVEAVKVDPADDRAAFCARQPVSPARRNRARDPHAPESDRARGPEAGSEAAGAGRTRAGLSQGRVARSRRGDLRQAARLRTGAKTPSATCSRSISSRRIGRRRSRSPRSCRISRRTRKSPSTIANWRRPR